MKENKEEKWEIKRMELGLHIRKVKAKKIADYC